MNYAVPFAKDNLLGLVSKTGSNAASNATKKFERRTSGKGAIRAGKGFTLFFSNENVHDIIKIVESLEKSGLLIDGAGETLKHEVKKPRKWIFFLPRWHL